MTDLTFEQIAAAQGNDLAATTAVIAAMESRVGRLARAAATRMATSGDRYMDYVEEFTQVGRIAVWEGLTRFDGSTVDSFFAYMHVTVERTLLDAVRSERNAGADPDAVKVFASMLEMADGDVYLAEAFAQSVPPKGKRMSAERASAARLAWQGTASLDVPIGHSAHPGVGSGQGKPTPGTGISNGVTLLVDTLASDIGIPEDLITADDLNGEARRVKHAIVHGILGVMGDAQCTVLKHSFGIGGAAYYGHGAAGNDAGMSAETGMGVPQIRDARKKGLKTFAKRYVKTIEPANPAYAAELTAAATRNLSPGGRK